MLNCLAEPLDSMNVLEALSCKLDIKRHSPSILHLLHSKIENDQNWYVHFHFWNVNSWNMKLFVQSIYWRWNSITWLVPFGCPRSLLLKAIGVTKFILYIQLVQIVQSHSGGMSVTLRLWPWIWSEQVWVTSCFIKKYIPVCCIKMDNWHD